MLRTSSLLVASYPLWCWWMSSLFVLAHVGPMCSSWWQVTKSIDANRCQCVNSAGCSLNFDNARRQIIWNVNFQACFAFSRISCASCPIRPFWLQDMTVNGKYTNVFFSGALDLYGSIDGIWHNYIIACLDNTGFCAGHLFSSFGETGKLTSCLRHNVDRTGDGCAGTATHGLTCVLVVVDQCFMYRHCMHTKYIGSRAVIWLRERYWRMAGQDMLIGTSTHLSKACWEFGDHWKWNDWF